MIEDLLKDISLVIIGTGIIVGSVILLSASVYDIAYTLKRRSLATMKRSAKRAKRPTVTVIVYSHNQSQATIKCLDSITKSSYRKLQVIVLDDASSDGTTVDVKKFIKARKRKYIKLVSKQRHSGPQKSLQSALKLVKGDIVLVLDPDYRLTPKTLGLAMERFMFIDTEALMPAVIINDQPSVLNLWDRFKNISGLSRQKMACLISGQGCSFRFGIFYRPKILKTKTMNVTGIYASDVVLHLETKNNLAQPKTSYYGLIARKDGGGINVPTYLFKFIGIIIQVAVLPVFLWYSLYEALNNSYPDLIVISFAIFTFFVLVAVWSVEQFSLVQKTKYSVLVPAMFSVFYIMSFAGAVGFLLRPLRRFKLKQWQFPA